MNEIKSAKAGRCECCGKHFGKPDMNLRLPRLTPKGKWTGMKVCRFCSPHYTDDILRRYELDIAFWPVAWTTGSYEIKL